MASVPKLYPAIAILLPFLSSGFGQQPADQPTRAHSVLVNVLDEHGQVVRDLTKANFRVRLNGVAAPVLDARYSLAPRRIVVLLDMSGSMSESMIGKWQIACEAVHDLLTQTPDSVPIAMLTFAGKVIDVFDFSPTTRAAIAKWMAEGPGRKPYFKSPAKTALFDAIVEVMKLLHPFQSGDAVYVITDGVDNASHVSADQTKVALLQSSVRLFAFLLVEPVYATEERERIGSFRQIVDESGGFIFEFGGSQPSFSHYYLYDRHASEMIMASTRNLTAQVAGFWTLDLAALSAGKKNKMKMEIVDNTGRPRKGITVTYNRILPVSN